MNSNQAKQLSLPDILSRLGYEPVATKKGGTERWYVSPFRSEKEPSFVTSFLGGKWIWNDFGDSGGTVIDFVMRHQHFLKVSQALEFLEDLYRTGSVSKIKPGEQTTTNYDLFSPIGTHSHFNQQELKNADTFEKELEFIRAEPISNAQIIRYLTIQRCIQENLVRKYLRQVTYRNKKSSKEFFAFGIENRSGGYEIRAATDDYPFKSALNGRDISLLKWHTPVSQTVFIFEGMTDFLSLLTLNNVENLEGDVILMHSLSSSKETISFLKQNQYEHILLFLDNDEPGKKTTARFVEELGQCVKPQNELYFPYKDINEMLCKK